MTLDLESGPVSLDLAGWDQAFHTPSIALATMLHRNVVLLHGADDAWVDAEESRLLRAALVEAGNEPMLIVAERAGHDLAEADDGVIAEFGDSLVARMEPRELPPVLVAIEEMGGPGR
jgi:hypothetical protein